MAINRGPWNALVDDDGSNLTGSIWNKAQIATTLLDPIDALTGGVFVDIPLVGNNFSTNSGAGFSLTGFKAGYTVLNQKVLYLNYGFSGITLSSTATFIYWDMVSTVPAAAQQIINAAGISYGTIGGGAMVVEVNPATPRRVSFLRDIGGTPWQPATNNGWMQGQLFYFVP